MKGSDELKTNIRALQDRVCVIICFKKKFYKEMLRKGMEGEQGEKETGLREEREGEKGSDELKTNIRGLQARECVICEIKCKMRVRKCMGDR